MNKPTLKKLSALDPVMATLIERAGPIDLKPRRLAPYQALVRAIIYQQLSGKAAETIFKRFIALFPNDPFPKPEAVAVAEADFLRTAGVSRQKSGYLRDLAEKTLAGIVPGLEECDSLTDVELLERLTEIKGVGRWTVEMLLIFNLGRPNVLPIHDLGVRKGFQIAYKKRKMPEPKHLEKFGAKWHPYRTTAAWYLWRAADDAK